jgi:hypothetical protein
VVTHILAAGRDILEDYGVNMRQNSTPENFMRLARRRGLSPKAPFPMTENDARNFRGLTIKRGVDISDPLVQG